MAPLLVLLAAFAGLAIGWVADRALAARCPTVVVAPLSMRITWPVVDAIVLASGTAAGSPLMGLAAVALLEAARADLVVRRIPDDLTLVVAVAAVGLRLAGELPLAGPAAAAATATGLLLGVRSLGTVMAGRPGMGFGDVKLAAALALAIGWSALWVLYLAAVGVVVLAAWERLRARPTVRTDVPFAPFIAAGGAAALFLPTPW